MFNATTVMRMFAAALVVVCLAGPSAMGAGQTEDGRKRSADAGSARGPSSSARATKERQKKADPVQAMLDRVGQMASSAQRAWLKRLEQRAARAARLTLRPEDAARQQARTHAQLHQTTITWQVLREVIRDTDAREKDAIDWLVRQLSYAGLRQLSQAGERLRAAAAGVARHLFQLDASRQPVRATGPADRLAGAGHPQRDARARSARSPRNRNSSRHSRRWKRRPSNRPRMQSRKTRQSRQPPTSRKPTVSSRRRKRRPSNRPRARRSRQNC